MKSNQSVKLKIYGKVQGVFYRTAAREMAKKLNISGFAKNEPDGAVLIIANGFKKSLEKFIKWCYYGPKGSVVEKIDVEGRDFSEKYNNFDIK